MSLVKLLINSRDNLSVKFMEFTRIVSKNKGKVAVFFEGQDEKYYSVRINSIRPDIQWSGINSGGKSNVIKLRKKIRSHSTYANSSCIFFVDSDFDENNSIKDLEDIYITPCYSVENFYITNAAFERILSAEFGINDALENENCYNNAISTFKKMKNNYIDSIKEFNFLIRELRLMGHCGELTERININNLNYDSLIKLNLDYVEKVYDESNPKSLFPELPANLSVNLESSKKHFSPLSAELWFRGKQHLEFLRILLMKFKEDRCKKGERVIFANRGNVKLQLTKGNCISELSQYADTPCCLKIFLEKQIFVKLVI